MKPLVLALGEILWDLLPAGKQLGGAPANFAYHAAQLGCDTRTVSAVGDDDLGREITARLQAVNLDTGQITTDRGHPTGTVSVTLTAGQPSYTIHENVAWDFLPCTPALLDLAARADCICFGTLAQRSETSRATIRNVLSHSRPGALRIFDINLRQRYYSREIIEEYLALATVLKINDDELPAIAAFLLGANSPAGLFKRFANLRLVALTRGGKGSALFSADGSADEHPGYPVEHVADTIGAGDAFTAALAVGMLNQSPLKQINEQANCLASFVCTQVGATPVIPESVRSAMSGKPDR
jgi:fructokinase